MQSTPRVAIVGGGLAGSLCALVVRNRGMIPIIFDAGRRCLGGRLAGGLNPDSGAQFLRGSEPSQFTQVLDALARENLIAPWNGRFGVLGSRGGGFLPVEALQRSAVQDFMGSARSHNCKQLQPPMVRLCLPLL